MSQAGNAFRCHFTPAAMRHEVALDVFTGADILLHLNPRPSQAVLVVNSFLDGDWQQELRIPLDAEAFQQPLLCDVTPGAGGLHIVVNNTRPQFYAVDVARFSGAELRVPQGVEWLPPEGDPQPGTVRAQITVADIMHVKAQVTISDPRWAAISRRKEAFLTLLIDGRPVRRLFLPSVLPVGGASREMQFQMEEDCFAADGMYAEIALEWRGVRSILDRIEIGSRFLGGIESCSETCVKGFAANPQQPGRPVLVDVFCNRQFCGTALADLPRPDLAELGPCGFSLNFDPPLWLPPGQRIAVSVFVHDTDLALAGSPWPLVEADPAEVTQAIAGTADA